VCVCNVDEIPCTSSFTDASTSMRLELAAAAEEDEELDIVTDSIA